MESTLLRLHTLTLRLHIAVVSKIILIKSSYIVNQCQEWGVYEVIKPVPDFVHLQSRTEYDWLIQVSVVDLECEREYSRAYVRSFVAQR